MRLFVSGDGSCRPTCQGCSSCGTTRSEQVPQADELWAKQPITGDVIGPCGSIQREPLHGNQFGVRSFSPARRRFALENRAMIGAPPNVCPIRRIGSDIREQVINADANAAFLEDLAHDARVFVLILVAAAAG